PTQGERGCSLKSCSDAARRCARKSLFFRADVTLTVECLDRLYLNVIQPRLQVERGIAYFFCQHRGEQFATAKTMVEVTRPFVAAIEQFAQTEGRRRLAHGTLLLVHLHPHHPPQHQPPQQLLQDVANTIHRYLPAAKAA